MNSSNNLPSPQHPDSDSLLSKETVLTRLGIGEKALKRLIREGRLRAIKFGRTSPLKFRQLDVARCLEACLVGGVSGHTGPR